MVNKTQPRGSAQAAPPADPPKQEVSATVHDALSTEGFNNVPDFMRGDAGQGTEHIGREDMETPRLKLISAVNPELQQYDGLLPGMFLHTASGDIMKPPFRVVALYTDKRFILWNPRDSGGGILARADDAIHWNPPSGEFTVKLDKKDGGATVKWKLAATVEASRLAEWGTMDPADPKSQPAATEMYNFVFAFPDYPDLIPAVFSFQRGSIRAGRKLNTKLKTVRAPIYGVMMEMDSEVDKNSRNQDYYVPVVTAKGLLTDGNLYSEYKTYYEGLRSDGLKIKDIESAQDEAAEPAAEGGGKDGKPSY